MMTKAGFCTKGLIFAMMFAVCTCINVARCEEETCNIYALVERTKQDEALANEVMANAAIYFSEKMECKLTSKDKEEIKKTPEAAEEIISKRDMECYKRMLSVYTKGDEESKEILNDVTVEAIFIIAEKANCRTDKSEIDRIINREGNIKEQETSYTKCLFMLRRILSAEKLYKEEKRKFTADLNALASRIVPAGEALPNERFALDEIRTGCCAAPDCDEEKEEEQWNVDFGIELSKEHGVILYGYPISGPNCLIMVTPEKDDPADFAACYREAAEEETSGDEEDAGEEDE